MLKKTLAALALGSALFTAGQAMAADYKIDKEGQHAFIEFRIKHLGYSWLYGRFNDFDGSFTFDEKNPSADKVKVTIMFRGREVAHPELGERILNRVTEDLKDLAVVEMKPEMLGRDMNMLLAPVKVSA